jgi:succinate-semialdehyde dehydrogenase / glutarate-semialdehyde dehydrogenase
MKVDSKTPLSGLIGLELLEDAGLPGDVLQVVTGSGAELGPELIARVDYVMFTGSTATGWSVAKQAAERLIPSSMELGGKNAMLVLADASLTRAMEGAERAMFSNAGQLCISIERLFVHESIAEEFVRRLVKRVGRARPDLGPYFFEPTLLGDVAEGMSLFADETFGPVVAVSTFSDEEEAVARANQGCSV